MVVADRSERPRPGERGAATVLVVPAALAICATCLLGVARIGSASVARAHADAVADLTALATVTGGDAGAAAVASANGARLLDVVAGGAVRTVRVDDRGVSATASAAPSSGGGG